MTKVSNQKIILKMKSEENQPSAGWAVEAILYDEDMQETALIQTVGITKALAASKALRALPVQSKVFSLFEHPIMHIAEEDKLAIFTPSGNLLKFADNLKDARDAAKQNLIKITKEKLTNLQGLSDV